MKKCMVAILALCFGCVSPETQNAIDRNVTELDRVDKEILTFETSYGALKADLAQGKITQADYDPRAGYFEVHITELQKARDKFLSEGQVLQVTAAQEKKLSWLSWLGIADTGVKIGTSVATFIPVIGFLVPILGLIGTILGGIKTKVMGG